MQPEHIGRIKGEEAIPVAGFSAEGQLLFSNAAFREIADAGAQNGERTGLVAGDGGEFLAAVQKACRGTACSLQAKLEPSGILTRFSLYPSSGGANPFALAVGMPDRNGEGAGRGAPLEMASDLPFAAGDETVFIADADRRILEANDSACMRFGYTREEMLRLRIDDIVAPTFRESTPAEHALLLKNGGGSFENLHVTRDGRVFPVEVHATVIEYRGKPAILSISWPIKEVRRTDHASEALREMEKKYRSFFEAASEGFIVTDSQGVVIDINERFAGLLGQPKRLIIGHNLFSFFIQNGAYDPELLIRSAIENGCVLFETEVVTQEGNGAVLALECCPIILQGEQCIRVIARDISGHRIPEAEMNRSPDFYLTAFDLSGTGLVIIDMDGRIVHANPETGRIFGASADELREMSWAEFVKDPLLSGIAGKDRLPEGSDGFCIDNHESNVTTGAGEEIPVVISVRAIPGTSMYIASVQDISQQRKRIGELSEDHEKFEALFSSGCESFILLDDSYDIRMWNAAAEDMFGYSAEEVSGKNIFPLLFSRGPEEGQKIFQRFFNPDATSSGRTPVEISLSTKEGGAIHTEASVSRFTHYGSTYLLLTIRDNTERHQFIESLTESEEFLRFAIDAARVGIWDYDMEKDVFSLGDDVYSMLALSGSGSSALSVSSDAWRSIIHPDDILSSDGVSLALMSGSITEFESELRLKVVDGTWNWFALEGKVVEYDSTGRPQRVVGIIRDVQGKKQAESAIREANRKLSLLAGITRHDILNQIQGLLFYSEEMKTGEYTVDEMVVMAGKIYEMTETINRQITRTRNYDMLGTEPPEWQNVHYLADEIVAEMDGLKLSYRNESPMVEVYADYLFAEVLRTIFENAAMHAHGGTTLSVSFAETDEGGVLIIEDDGCGIPLRNKEKIFSHGFSKGAGGGLFIAREISGVTGIEFYETGEVGTGARFELRIPKSGYRFTRNEEKEEE